MKRLALAAALLLALVACGPTAGVVVEKEHRAAYTSVIWNGKTLMPISHPECWRVVVEADGKTGSHCVDGETWDAATVGEYIDLEEA